MSIKSFSKAMRPFSCGGHFSDVNPNLLILMLLSVLYICVYLSDGLENKKSIFPLLPRLEHRSKDIRKYVSTKHV